MKALLALVVAVTNLPTVVTLTRSNALVRDGEGKVVDWKTLEACEVEAAKRIQAETRTSGTLTYKCTLTAKYSAKFSPGICPAPPASESRACPSGTLQTRSYVTMPFPECSLAGNWIPECPSEFLLTLASPEVNVVAASWTKLPNATYDLAHCFRAGCTPTAINKPTSETSIRWTLNDDILVYKLRVCAGELCDTREVTVAKGNSTPGAANLKWTQEGDSPASYRINYSQKEYDLNQSIVLSGAARSHVMNLSPGKWFFSLVAIDSNGHESPSSNIVSKEI